MRPLQFYDKTFVNESGETVPPYGVLKITGWEADRNERDHFTATKPDGSEGIFLLNSMFPVPDGKIGHLTDHNGMRAKVKTGSPENGEIWGPEDGSWGLVKDAPGFKIVGDFAAGAVRVMFSETPAGGDGGIQGAFAIVKGQVPASSDVDTGGTLSGSSNCITPGVLAATPPPGTTSSFDTGALIVDHQGHPILKGGVIQVLSVINPGNTAFKALHDDDGVGVAGSIIEVEQDDPNDPKIQYFVLPRWDIRTEPKYDKNKAQAVYHAEGSDTSEVDGEPCE